jgi:CheY-like chemotaxis protein
MAKVRVMLVDDHALFRQGLRTLLESRGEFEVVAEAVEGQEAVEKAGQFQPDIPAGCSTHGHKPARYGRPGSHSPAP